MRASILAVVLFVCAVGAYAQESGKTPAAQAQAKPSITVDQIMEKSIAATGGREAAQKLTSLVMTGTMDIVAMGASASTEVYAKAPDKHLNITNVEGFGEISEGYDGKAGWHTDPQGGLVDLTGERLATARIQSQFNGDLKWKELYAKSEVTGKEKVGDRDCWVVKLTPAEGSPVTRYYDAETFLLVKALTTADTGQGPTEIAIEFSDYGDIGNGSKMAHKVKITIPSIGDLVTTYKEIKYNVPIDDAKFAKPKS